jgi:hypothetical protein
VGLLMPPLFIAIEDSIDLIAKIIEELILVWPTIPRSVLLALIRACWPPSSGRGAVPLLDATLVHQAHDGYLEMDPEQNCKTACYWLAETLGTSPRTIENYLRRAHRKH